MIPFVDDPDFTLYVGDVREVLAGLPDGSVNCCVTSPPYWNLRDYGSDGQIGLEDSPDAFVAVMVDVFREVRRVLADDGTLWLNLGDSYNAYNGNRGETGSTLEGRRQHLVGRPRVPTGSGLTAPGLKQKDLVGIPWLVAFALRADGWYLRSDIIWAKPNPMPESVTDRPTKSHEYVFLLSKSPRYYFDQEAVREKYAPATVERDAPPATVERHAYGYNHAFANQFKGSPTDERHQDGKTLPPGSFAKGPDGRKVTKVVGADGSIQHRDGERWPNGGRNIRTVWEIATQPYAEAHFATFPEELPRRCIAAGCPEWVCSTCGKARERIVGKESRDGDLTRAQTRGASGKAGRVRGRGDDADTTWSHRTTEAGTVPSFKGSTVETLGWSDCGHNDYRPGVVLDPFMGSGTTALVARKLNRRSIGIELSPEYAALCARRLQQLSLLA